MTTGTNVISVKNLLYFEIVVMFGVAVWALLNKHLDFCYGLLISLVNVVLYYGFYAYHSGRVSRYPAQALVVVISSTLVRFLLIGGLLVLVLQNLDVVAKPLFLGFVLGQLFFLIHHLLVVTNNVK
ncbi:MAG: hypothetical protein CR975_06185 [Gammaproteobacteria bacterium]|nr:MAG: hypothetical protein CR975_06185 [Gammaproteobacteria bacterium]